METKNSIRNRLLALRNEMDIEDCVQKSRQIMEKVLALPAVQNAEYVLCYAGYKSEVMTNVLIVELLKMEKKIYLPRVSGDEMDFYRVNSLAELEEGYKGIPEPALHCADIFVKELWEKNQQKVIMFLPGAAFSEDGARIGYGKGYYDRYLERIPCVERIALCYEMQVVETISTDEHDMSVTVVVTEEKVRRIKDN